MSKRNFILLIIILGLIVIGFFAYLYFNKGTVNPFGNNNTETNFGSKFNPFPTNSTPTQPTTPTTTDDGTVGETNPDTTIPLQLAKISSMPIAGFTVFQKERLKEVPVPEAGTAPATTTKPTPPATEFVPALRYVDRALGNIYETFIDKITERKLSETTVPRVYDAYFGNNGNTVAMRYLKPENISIIETFVGTLPKELLGGDTTSTDKISGYFLPENIKSISLSPNTSKLFYLFESGDAPENTMTGVVLNFGDNKKTQIFSSPFTEWSSWWPNDKTITLSTKPSSSVPGYIYTMGSDGKNFSKTLGGTLGLTTLTSPDSKLILTADSNLNLSIYDKGSGNSSVLSVKTLPEKCIWSKASDALYCAVPKSIPNGSYPDSWYQGEISFNDDIWKIDVKTGAGTLLVDPATFSNGEEIDGIKLALDDGENNLFFVNKKDSFLWKLKIK